MLLAKPHGSPRVLPVAKGFALKFPKGPSNQVLGFRIDSSYVGQYLGEYMIARYLEP